MQNQPGTTAFPDRLTYCPITFQPMSAENTEIQHFHCKCGEVLGQFGCKSPTKYTLLRAGEVAQPVLDSKCKGLTWSPTARLKGWALSNGPVSSGAEQRQEDLRRC